MRTITIALSLSLGALPLLADLGPERVIAPPAGVSAVARSDDVIAVVLSTSAGTRAVLTGFDGAPVRSVSLSDASVSDAAAASDGSSILFTWLEGDALHASLLRGGESQSIALSDAPSAAPLFALFDGARYVVLTAHEGVTISTAGVVEERFPLPVPTLAAAAAGNGRIVVAWVEDDRKLIQLKAAELLPDHSVGTPQLIASQVVTVSGQYWINNVALAFSGSGGYAAWSRLAGRCCNHVEGSRLASDLTPLDSVRSPFVFQPQYYATQISTTIYLGSTTPRVTVAAVGSAFFVAWQFYWCGCLPLDGVSAAEVDSGGFARPEFQIRRGAINPMLIALPDRRAAIVYSAPEGVVLHVFAASPHRRAVTR